MAKKYFFGFTLVELLIVLSLIAVLGALVVSLFTGQIFKGNDAKRKGDLDRIKIAVEEYEKDHNCYPGSVSCVSPNILQPYLDTIPCDPVTHDPYAYERPSCPGWFRIYAILQNTQDSSLVPGIGPGGIYNYYVGSGDAPVLSPFAGATPTTPASPVPGGNYGCKSGSCVPLSWNPLRLPSGGWECDPNFGESDCGASNGKGCSGPYKWPECVHW